MVFERPQYILLPVRISTIVVSFLIALLLNFLPWRELTLVPDFVALVLTFWCVRQPRMVGLGIAWMLGLLMDTGNGTLLGQHALTYSLIAFFAITLSRRILWFPWLQQALHVAALLLSVQMIGVAVRMLAGGQFPGWTVIVGPLLSALLWPVLSFVLLAPQRRPMEIDETRPI